MPFFREKSCTFVAVFEGPFRRQIYNFLNYDDSALTLAQHLLQIKAVKLSPKVPFTWASGLKSPIYCDNRVTLSYPAVRTYIRQQFVEISANPM